MAVQQNKRSPSQRNMRRAHDGIKFSAAVEYCTHCGEPKLRHNLCAACGTYRGRQIRPGTADAAAEVGGTFE